mgnify:FL=1
MESKGSTILLLSVLSVVAVLLLVAAKNGKVQKGYSGQTDSGSGFWNSLWNNAANIVDSGGRHTSSFVTSLTNGVSSIIATKNSGKFYPSQYGYSDQRQDYGPYVLAGAMVLTAGVIAALVLIKK